MNSNKPKITRLMLLGLIILLPFIIMMKNSFSDLQQSKLENTLLTSENYTSASSIVEKAIDCLKSGDIVSMESLLSSDCEFYNISTKYSLSSCLENLSEYKSCWYEERGNSIGDEKTYRIYWNGYNLDNAQQIITLILKKKVTQSAITYEIKNIILSNNTI